MDGFFHRQRAAAPIWILAGLFLLGGGGAETVLAEDSPVGSQAAPRDERVLEFVRAQSPDLAAVLGHLARRSPADYEAAIADLAGTIAKLAAALEKDPALHAIELELWRTRTSVELLGARLVTAAAKDRAGLEAKLRDAVAAELEAKAAQLTYRRQRSMAWYDRQIDRIRDERDELVESRVRSLMRGQGGK